MKSISKQEIYLKGLLEKEGIEFKEQVRFVYHTFKDVPRGCRKQKVYTADFVIGRLVVEVKGNKYARFTWAEKHCYIYDYLYQNNYLLVTIPAKYKDLDKFIKELTLV